MVADHRLTPEQLRERLNRDLPGVVVQPLESGNGTAGGHTEAHGAFAADMLKTSDTLIAAERLIEAATYLRDMLGYAFLSDITVIDYLSANVFEVAYLFYHPDGGTHLMLKVRIPREKPTVPSLTPIWPGAELMEREGYDLFGVNFVGHPYLKRIYMWDEFEGHPMRKDFPKQGDKYLDEV